MKILMLGNSFTYANDMPSMLAEITGAEVVQITRGGARLAEPTNPNTRLGKKTFAALEEEHWDYVVLQEMSNGPITAKASFMKSVSTLCEMIRDAGAVPVLFATWAYRRGAEQYEEVSLDYDGMAEAMSGAYREAAEENRALLADVGRKFYEAGGAEELYAEDGSHPSEAGSRLAAGTIAEVIREDRGSGRPVDNLTVPKVNSGDIRLRVLYMYQILLKYTDAEHPLTTNQIRDLMEKKYGITMHRTTVPGDIEVLKAAGFDIVGHRYRQNKYYLESRQFELPELKILIDAVESSRFITERKSRRLVEKLVALTNERNAGQLKRNLYTPGRVRSANEKGYYIVDAINTAINEGRRISFFYTDYDGRKKQILRNDGNAYTVSPFTLIWNGDFYYLVGYDHAKESVRTYRVDRILKQPEILAEDALPVPDDFDVTRYTREVFRMYANQEPEEVTLICRNEVMKGIIDQFGMDVKVRKADKEHFRTKVRVCVSPTFYGWVFTWGGDVKIEGPENVLAGYREMLGKALEK